MRDFGTKPRLVWIDVASLRVDVRYQRSMEGRRSQNLIDRICEKFRWAAFQAIVVTPDDAGHLVIDGQHRVEVARRLGIARVPAIVVEGLSLSEQAALFVDANQSRVIINPFSLYHARLMAGDAKALAVAAFCRGSGVEIPRSVTQVWKLKPRQTLALKLIEEIALDASDADGRAAISLLLGVWPLAPGALSAVFIRAVTGALRECMGGSEKISAFLSGRSPLELLKEYRGGGATQRLQFDLIVAVTGRASSPQPQVDDPDEAPRYVHPLHPMIDPERHAFVVAGKAVACTSKEWAIFEFLAERGGRLVSHERLYGRLYTGDEGVEDKIIDVFICKLRSKCPFPIETVWGEGYILNGYRMERRVPNLRVVEGLDRNRLMAGR